MSHASPRRPEVPAELTTDDGERAVGPRESDPRGYRSYEIYQRQRITESSPDIVPRHLWSHRYLADPYALVAALREHGPCFRDWTGNAFWVTRYDDVTSVLVDDANYETRTRRWALGLHHRGRDLGQLVPVAQAEAEVWEREARPIAERLVDRAVDAGRVDLALGVADRLAAELECRVLGLGADEWPWFVRTAGRIRSAGSADPTARRAAQDAFDELATRFGELLDRREAGGDDLLSAAAALELDRPVTGDDVAATVLEADAETLPGSMANLWYLLATHPEVATRLVGDRRLVTSAWLEAVRHSPPLVSAERWARHEVERFGRLLPEGARLICSVAAANRDPRVFADPDRFDPFRLDLCRRETRGQYRADGLPSGIVPALGPPARFPAVPEDRPRSRYARVRDVAVTATDVVLDRLGALELVDPDGAAPRARRVGGPHRSWELVVTSR